MRRWQRLARSARTELYRRRPRLVMAAAAAATGAAVLVAVLAPAAPGAARLAVRLAAAVHTLGLKAHKAAATRPRGAPAGGAAAIGTLFTSPPGSLPAGGHFCTASVVDSPAGDLVMTAAHCVSGLTPSQFVFVPGYQNGKAPYGVWSVSRVIVDQAWSTAASPDDDVAFLVVDKPGTTASVQSITGGERLGVGQPAGQLVQVTGYPNGAGTPISCLNRAVLFSPTQLEFDCDGYANGTSGSPLLADVDPFTGLGTVIGVIGGYQQGGDTSSVSYADRLEANVATLYKLATSQP
ncbi:MAG TPA: trypsin-like serine protease [Streptosporangiaceae bacterium]|nr:trypsin-like serine protease [Streptosporangiaceae bacterium]